MAMAALGVMVALLAGALLLVDPAAPVRLAPAGVILAALRRASSELALAAAHAQPGEPSPMRPPGAAAGGDSAPADAALRREGRDFIEGGFLVLPPSFASQDGGYDLVVHFHGNTDLVAESYVASGLNAAVLILNYGMGSGVYEKRFFHPAVLARTLREVRAALEARGLRGARQRRMALSAWSAGYGAVLRTLGQPEFADQVDAVLLLDGLHCGYNADRAPAIDRIEPFVRFAMRAASGERLLVITHSDIRPDGDYAGTRETIDAVLERLRVRREPLSETPLLPALPSLGGVLPRRLLRPLDPLTVARAGGLVVRGYAGAREEHHVMHLAQMAVIALPDLARFWGRSGAERLPMDAAAPPH